MRRKRACASSRATPSDATTEQPQHAPPVHRSPHSNINQVHQRAAESQRTIEHCQSRTDGRWRRRKGKKNKECGCGGSAHSTSSAASRRLMCAAASSSSASESRIERSWTLRSALSIPRLSLSDAHGIRSTMGIFSERLMPLVEGANTTRGYTAVSMTAARHPGRALGCGGACCAFWRGLRARRRSEGAGG